MNHLRFDQHRAKLIALFADHPGAVLLHSAPAVDHWHTTDTEIAYRPESDFYYLTGITEPECRILLDPRDGAYHVFVPRRDAQFAVWHGYVTSLEEWKSRTGADQVHYVDELPGVLAGLKATVVHTIARRDADFLAWLGYKAETGYLSDMLAACRVIKTPAEIELMRTANAIASAAQDAVRAALRPGMFEYELKALFEYEVAKRGAHPAPYNGIHAAGASSAILHYTETHRRLEDGALYLCDAGAEWAGYDADLTRTWPVNGTFSPEQRDLYDVCLAMQEGAIAGAAPGVAMEDLHLGACRTLLEGLSNLGYVKGGIDELMEHNIFALFFPHGLGHFLGLDTHDPGGYPKGVTRIDRPGLRYLRTRRVLEPGMVVTIEPGIYCIPALLGPAMADHAQARYLDTDRLARMSGFGGIRIEDNIAITATGHDNLTTASKR